MTFAYVYRWRRYRPELMEINDAFERFKKERGL